VYCELTEATTNGFAPGNRIKEQYSSSKIGEQELPFITNLLSRYHQTISLFVAEV
jgi:hypothetical protein